MKKFVSATVVFAAVAVFSSSAWAAKTRIVSINAHGTATEKSGFLVIYDTTTGLPKAVTKAMNAARRNAREDARAQCADMGGRLRETMASRTAMVTWSQIGAKEYQADMDYAIDCLIREVAEQDPSVSDRQGLKPGEIRIGGKIYVEKNAAADTAN